MEIPPEGTRRLADGDEPARILLPEYVRQIDAFNASRPNAALRGQVRQFNHYCIDSIAAAVDLRGKRLLDIGASPRGYALERALQAEVSEYVGIGLGINQPTEIRHAGSLGRLLSMNAERLSLDSASFDAVVSMSAFEHISDVTSAVCPRSSGFWFLVEALW